MASRIAWRSLPNFRRLHGVWEATDETLVYADDIATDAKTIGTSPIFVFESFEMSARLPSLLWSYHHRRLWFCTVFDIAPCAMVLHHHHFVVYASSSSPLGNLQFSSDIARTSSTFSSFSTPLRLNNVPVFCFNWLQIVRFKHKNGTCKNVLNAFNPKLFSMLVSNTNGRIGLVSENNLATSCSASSNKILFGAG